MPEPITLVLGGTGVKGVASIGVLQSLHNHGIKIKKIIAAGISAPISAQYALGEDPDQLTEEFTRFFVENNHELWGLEQLTGILMSRRRRRLDNFAYFLRAILRSDPDVIMVGEIRDRETAETAVQSALTGHIVFSTLHTNNAAGVIPRLIDLGVNPKILVSALSLSIAQRLVRKLCQFCKKEKEIV